MNKSTVTVLSLIRKPLSGTFRQSDLGVFFDLISHRGGQESPDFRLLVKIVALFPLRADFLPL